MHENSIEFVVHGKYALFSDPINRVGGEKLTYQVPTYEALKGIVQGIYWKPTLTWVIDEVKIMNPIRSESKSIRPILYNGGNTLSVYTYLSDVRYKVKAHFEWNENRPDLIFDRNENKHHNIAKRYVERGGRRDIFLGTRECMGYIEYEKYNVDEVESFYKGYGELPLGVMFHGFTYPDENKNGEFVARFWKPVMKDGIIKFIRPDECTITKKIYTGNAKKFILGDNFSSVNNFDISVEFGGDTCELVD